MKGKIAWVAFFTIVLCNIASCGRKDVQPEVSATPSASDSKEASTIENYGNNQILMITYIGDTYFKAQMPGEREAIYIVHTSLDNDYCIGDYVNVSYEDCYKIAENEYEIEATEVNGTDYIYEDDTDYKPVIYLYPVKEESITVKLDYKGTLIATSPKYDDGWKVTAKPDGTIVTENGDTYPYLFWEGQREMSYPMDQGFCVKGSDTEQFLQEKLTYMGLNENETADFIQFWLPYMRDQPYNLISFQGSEYSDYARLTISPEPDSILRVYMVFTPLKDKTEIQEQKLRPFKRTGFTVVEWGGTMQ